MLLVRDAQSLVVDALHDGRRALALVRRYIRANVRRCNVLRLLKQARQIAQRAVGFAKLAARALEVVCIRLPLLERLAQLLRDGSVSRIIARRGELLPGG